MHWPSCAGLRVDAIAIKHHGYSRLYRLQQLTDVPEPANGWLGVHPSASLSRDRTHGARWEGYGTRPCGVSSAVVRSKEFTVYSLQFFNFEGVKVWMR